MAVQSMKWLLKNWYALTATQLRKLNDYDNLRNQYNSVKSRADQFYIGRQINCNQGIHRWLINGLAISEDTTMTMIPSGRVTGQLSYNGSMFVTTDSGWFKVSDILQNGGVSYSPLTHICHALILTRKELHMAVKRIKFQLKDWDAENPNYPSYIGKTVIPSKKIFYYSINDRGVFENTETTERPPRGVVIGQYRQGQIYLTTEPTSFNLWFRLHDLIEYGGVSSSPLTHLYQSLRHLLDRKVALA